jgi:prostaglandin-endoperoxide synthase 2
MGDLLSSILSFFERLFPRLVNRIKINVVVRKEKRRRPHPYSLWTSRTVGPPPDPSSESADVAQAPHSGFAPSDYVSWPGLTERTYTGRHLPPDPNWTGALPDERRVFDDLFRREGEIRPGKSTALFCFFAQWFTDSFLRTKHDDRRRHTGNNEIDYCQIYGLDETTAWTLRTRSGGRMRVRTLDGGDRLPFLVVRDGNGRGEIDPALHDLPYIDKAPGPPPTVGTRFKAGIERATGLAPLPAERWENMYATGLDRGNSTIFYTALSTMCVREHNRIAGELARLQPGWDDDRLFETARLINIHNVLEIVIEDYINHIAGEGTFKLDSGFAEREPWYRTNRISLEFNLLYRWHSLVPDEVEFNGETLGHLDYRFNNLRLEQSSPEALINAASAAPAGRIGVRNTPGFLEHAEIASIRLSREFRLQPFNAYCERFGHGRYSSIDELAGDDARTAATLKQLYGDDVDKVEFLAGLYAERRAKGSPDSVLPPVLRTMVAVDAFTHILTNPVLSHQVREAAFAPRIAHLIAGTGGVVGLMERTSRGPVKAVPSFSLTA